jgi:hypothetical protein
MTAYTGQTRTALDQLCTAIRDSKSRLDVIQLGFEPGTVVTPLALRCSALRPLRQDSLQILPTCTDDATPIVLFLAGHIPVNMYH